jgi:hypothetical protein
LRGPDSGDVPTRTAADHNDVRGLRCRLHMRRVVAGS